VVIIGAFFNWSSWVAGSVCVIPPGVFEVSIIIRKHLLDFLILWDMNGTVVCCIFFWVDVKCLSGPISNILCNGGVLLLLFTVIDRADELVFLWVVRLVMVIRVVDTLAGPFLLQV
jgi:hypothetical protein